MRSKVTPVNNNTAHFSTPNAGELRQIISLLPYPVAYLSAPAFTISLANDAQLRLLGLPEEQVLGQHLPPLFSPPYLIHVQQAIAQAASHDETVLIGHLHYGSTTAQGTRGNFKMEIRRVVGAGQNLLGLLCLSIPHEVKEVNAPEPARADNHYFQLFQNARVSLWDEDYSGVKTEIDRLQAAGISNLDAYFSEHPGELNRIISLVTIKGVNKATLQLHGGTREEMLSGLSLFFVADTLPAFLQQLKVVASGGGAYEYETVIRRKDGRLADVQVLINFPTGPDYSNVPVSLIDITEQKAAENALRQSEERQRTFVANAPVAIAMFDTNMCYMAVSERWMEFYQIEKDILGYSHYEVFPEMPEEWKVIHQNALAGQVVRSDEDKLVRADGSVQWLKLEVRPWHDLEGNVGGIIIFLEDVSKRKQAEEAVKESEARFRRIADHAPVMIWVTDDKGNCNYLNKQWYDFTGQTEAEALGLGWTNAVHPEEKEKAAAVFMEVSNTRSAYLLEFRLRKWDGTYEWMIDSAVPRFDEQGAFLGFTGSVVNIHQRKLAEEVQQKLNLHLELSTNSAGVGTWSLDLATMRVEWSVLHNKMWGYRQVSAQLSYADWYKVIVAEDREQAKQQVEKAKINRSRYENIYRIKRADDQAIRWIRSFGQFFYNPDGQPTTLTGISIDITEQKEAEEALRQSEERLRTLAGQLELRVADRTRELEASQAFLQSVLDTTQNGIISYLPLRNADGKIEDFQIQFMNDQVIQDLGLKPGQFTGKTMREVFPKAFEDGWFEHMVQYVEKGGKNSYDLVFLVNGRTKYYHATVSRLGAGVTITVTNITEQKESALQLEQINAELQRSNSDLQQFAHVASHDLKEPLRKIRTFQSMIVQKHGKSLPVDVNNHLERIAHASRRMNDMIEGVLQYSKPDTSGTLPEIVYLNNIVSDVATDLELMITQKMARINCMELPRVKGTPILLYQLFYNLVFNALKFSQKDRPPEITIKGKVEADGFVAITVRDNGIGFAQEHAEKIFHTFTRLYSKDQYEGSGLGLALCRKIAERHGGTISAISSPGEGATFMVRLPNAVNEL